jgi:ATP-dependent RNA helicase MSS116
MKKENNQGSKNILCRALAEMQYETCTKVQAASLPVCLSGVDVVCKAKTGTGKTLAFLIPAIERLKQRQRPARGTVSILVMSPTRELAYQIAAEAEELARHHGLTVQVPAPSPASLSHPLKLSPTF